MPSGKATQSKEQSELFVRNIPYEATSEDLSTFFSDFCPVKHAVIVTDSEGNSRGFGFASFAEADDAKVALEKGRATKFQGRFLQIDIAEKRERGGKVEKKEKTEGEDEKDNEDKEAPEGGKQKEVKERKPRVIEKRRPRLIIRNLPWSCKDSKKIEKIFAKFGNVVDAFIPQKNGKMSGFAFVTMRKKAHAQKAIDATKELKIDGRAVQVDYALEKGKWLKKQNGDVDESDEEESEEESESEEEEEEEEKAPKKSFKPASNEQTVFVRNIPYDCTEDALQEHFEEHFGPVLYALPVFDKKLNQPKGTAFVAFENAEDCDTCVREAPKISSTSLLLPDDVDSRYVFESRVLSITKALQRENAEKLATASANERLKLLGKAPSDKDKRNLFLLNEGRITKESKLAQFMKAEEIEIREKSYDLRKQQLNKNPTLHLSLTRIAIRNIPRAMNEKALKALGRKAVVEFAKEVAEKKRQALSQEELTRSTNYQKARGASAKSDKGVVRQSKIIMEQKGSGEQGRSRGYGFLEFRDHKTALMALRWMNAHEVSREELFSGLTEEEVEQKIKSADGDTRRRRLVVEFAIENAQVTKRRKETIIKAREAARKRKEQDEEEEKEQRSTEEPKPEGGDQARFIIGKKRKMRKMKHGN